MDRFTSEKGKTGGQQGDPLEMLVFILTTLHLWGCVLAKFQRLGRLRMEDGYIKTKLIVVLQVLVDLKHVRKEDFGLDLNVSKTSVLPKGVTQQVSFVTKTCRTIIDDVDKLDAIQDGFIHYQLLRFC